MKNTSKLSALAVALLGFATAGSAVAGSDSGNMNLSLTVDPECLLQVNDYVENTTGITVSQEGTLSVGVICNSGTAYEIEVDQGQNFGAAQPDMRALSSGSDFIAYSLYQDSAGTTVWGEGSDSIVGEGVGNNWQTYQPRIEFLIAGAPTGIYTDDLVVTVNWADI